MMAVEGCVISLCSPEDFIKLWIIFFSFVFQVAESFAKNYQLYCDNKPLKYVLDIKRGY